MAINAPLETVWNTLVKTDEALPFFFGSICETKDGMRAGVNYRMVSANRKVAMVVGEVLRFEPPYVYAHTFTMTNIDEPPVTVTYTLSETSEGTQFELRINDMVPGSKLAKERSLRKGLSPATLRRCVKRASPRSRGVWWGCWDRFLRGLPRHRKTLRIGRCNF